MCRMSLMTPPTFRFTLKKSTVDGCTPSGAVHNIQFLYRDIFDLHKMLNNEESQRWDKKSNGIDPSCRS